MLMEFEEVITYAWDMQLDFAAEITAMSIVRKCYELSSSCKDAVLSSRAGRELLKLLIAI